MAYGNAGGGGQWCLLKEITILELTFNVAYALAFAARSLAYDYTKMILRIAVTMSRGLFITSRCSDKTRLRSWMTTMTG